VILDKSKMADGLAVQTGASFIAGIVAALTSNPIDLAKSRRGGTAQLLKPPHSC
jgi:solute carrier family 25 oxoglutarate transporter 11